MSLLLRASLLIPLLSLSGNGRLHSEEELPVLVRSFEAVESPAPPFENGAFLPLNGETIAFIGGTNTFDQDRHGFVEARFHLAWPEHDLHLRNLAWQGDVLGYQARPRNFYTRTGDPQPGSVPDGRERTRPGIIFVCFGQMESLDGPGAMKGYDELIGQLETLTRRIVLVAPTPFFPVGPARAESETRNRNLAEAVQQVRQVAAGRGLLFVDLFTPLKARFDPALSSNGIHLTEAGHRAVADLIAEQLDFPAGPATDADSAVMQSLNQSIARKNRLWQQYYRPTNWAFLFGDRQHVPASRDPVEREQRWFLREIDSLPPLIAETEADIHRYAREAATLRKTQP